MRRNAGCCEKYMRGTSGVCTEGVTKGFSEEGKYTMKIRCEKHLLGNRKEFSRGRQAFMQSAVGERSRGALGDG